MLLTPSPTSDNPELLLEALRRSEDDRKLRLLACAFVRAVPELARLPRAADLLGVAERFAEGRCTFEEMMARRNAPWPGVAGAAPEWLWVARAAVTAVTSPSAWSAACNAANAAARAADRTRGLECARTEQARLVRELFGESGSPVLIVSTWLEWNDGTVRKMARAIRADHGYDRLPILGDALEEAGCGNAEILDHCRRPGEHHPGCWVVDALLREN